MQSGRDVPEIFIARIRSAGGPYRVDDGIAIAYSDPAVGRIIALESAVRTRCTHYARTSFPEIVSATVEHADAPYVAGETLTLYFVDPNFARIRRDAAGPQPDGDAEALGSSRAVDETFGERSANRQSIGDSVSYLPDQAWHSSPNIGAGEAMTLRADDRMAGAHPPDDRVADARTRGDRARGELASSDGVAKERTSEERAYSSIAANASEPAIGIAVRLAWSEERVRRFIAVVDRLFTIDRLGWYRHSLAMRLLIPDEIRSGDELADVEAMRHLHALRSAAVSALGKPLLAACMPGFTVTSDWLETLESPREARAIAGLREALLPYATEGAEDTNGVSRVADVGHTVGFVSKRALLAESATSVESFLPVLIPALSHDAALTARLMDYRNLLIELFAQTARATDPVRLGALAQPNHSLDDRLWQLVGAVGEAFGGFVHT